LYSGAQYLWALSLELPPYHFSGIQNFEAGSTLLENLCTLGLPSHATRFCGKAQINTSMSIPIEVYISAHAEFMKILI
jgi:hypothetical protein